MYTYKDITGLILENHGSIQCNKKGQESAVKGIEVMILYPYFF